MLWPIPSGALTAWQFRGTPKWLSLSLLLSKWVRYLVPTEDPQVSRLLWDLTASETWLGTACDLARMLWRLKHGKEMSSLIFNTCLVVAASCIWCAKISLQHWVHDSSCRWLPAKVTYFGRGKIPEDVVLTFHWFCSVHQAQAPQDAVLFRCAWAVAAKYSFAPSKVVLGGEGKGSGRKIWGYRGPEGCTVHTILSWWLLGVTLSCKDR